MESVSKHLRSIVNIIFLFSVIFLFQDCSLSKTKSPTNNKVTKVIKKARSYIGTPYKYGGVTQSGMDCSGLLIISFQSIQMKLPRSSHDQSKIGKPVKISNLAPGDLVCFSRKKGSLKVTHVGMVTKINGKNDVTFIHATTKLGVIENNVFSSYWKPLFVKARRLTFE